MTRVDTYGPEDDNGILTMHHRSSNMTECQNISIIERDARDHDLRENPVQVKIHCKSEDATCCALSKSLLHGSIHCIPHKMSEDIDIPRFVRMILTPGP